MSGVQQSNLASFQALFAGLADFAALVDRTGTVLHINAAGLRLVEREDGLGLPLEDLSPHAARWLSEWIPTALETGQWSGESELLRRSGEAVPVALTIAPVADGPDPNASALAVIARDLGEGLRLEEELQRRFLQQEAITAATSTPIIQVWDDIVTMPVVGLVDSVRAADMKNALLEAVSRTGARFAIVDLTGVDTVDTATADHLLRVMRAVRLLGARCVITGIQPAVAQIIVGLGLELQGVVTLRSLREGLRFCLRRLGFRVTREEQTLEIAPPSE
ncbi:MAG TPA: STAS domain-containing protein [Nannocystis sp.]